jgi:hypothetical protein
MEYFPLVSIFTVGFVFYVLLDIKDNLVQRNWTKLVFTMLVSIAHLVVVPGAVKFLWIVVIIFNIFMMVSDLEKGEKSK